MMFHVILLSMLTILLSTLRLTSHLTSTNKQNWFQCWKNSTCFINLFQELSFKIKRGRFSLLIWRSSFIISIDETELIQQLNDYLYKRCIEYGFNFIDNGAVSKMDLWADRIHLLHLLDSGKTKIVNNLISSFNYFLGTVIPNSRSR